MEVMQDIDAAMGSSATIALTLQQRLDIFCREPADSGFPHSLLCRASGLRLVWVGAQAFQRLCILDLTVALTPSTLVSRVAFVVLLGPTLCRGILASTKRRIRLILLMMLL
jgi:hypothetical protein